MAAPFRATLSPHDNDFNRIWLFFLTAPPLSTNTHYFTND
jgi:hypothetical protein